MPGDVSIYSDVLPEGAQDNYPFLFVENNLGVPQKLYYKLYVLACNAFDKNFTPSSIQSASLSSVILLGNPGHQHVLNYRKHLISNGLLPGDKELEFIATLFKVKECAKASILWHHRRWILFQKYSNESTTQAVTDSLFQNLRLPMAVLEGEFNLCTSACDIYPRNYFAWYHRTLCLRASFSSDTPLSNYHALLIRELDRAKMWMNIHLADFSAANYLFAVVEALLSVCSDFVVADALLTDVRDHSLQLLQTYPLHETTWQYFRRVHEEWAVNPSTGRSSMPAASTAEDEAKILLNAHKRSSRGKQNTEDKIVVNHARRYLTWKSGKVRGSLSCVPHFSNSLFESGEMTWKTHPKTHQ